MSYKGISLFSGCGGLDLGFEKSNTTLNDDSNNQKKFFEFIWANDIEEAACNTYAENFNFEVYKDPSEENTRDKIFNGDVREINFNNYFNKEEIDFITGGFPCQDFSMLRGKDKNRKGIKVKRGKLYLQFVRALVELQPKVFVAENVKGIKSANQGKAFKQILEDFQNLNDNWSDIKAEMNNGFNYGNINFEDYKILFSDVVNFSKHGVPQDRERLIFIGVREDLTDHIFDEQFINEIKNELNPKNKKSPLTPIEVFEGDILTKYDDKYRDIMKSYEDIIYSVDSIRANKYKEGIWPKYTFDIIKDYKRLNNIENNNINKQIEENHKHYLKEIGLYKKPVNKCNGKENKDGRTTKRVKERLARIPPGENYLFVKGTDYSVKGLMNNIYRRLHPLQPSPTIVANGGGGTWGYHYKINRQMLTNRERARIQTFPDKFKFKGNKTEIRRQIGNSVPPLAAKKIANIGKSILDKINI